MGIKLAALLTVAACGFLLGAEGRRRLSVRLRSMEMFRAVFREMRVTVAHSGLSLREVVTALADRQRDNRFLQVLRDNVTGRSFDEAWKLSLNAVRTSLCLRAQETELLTRCAGMLNQSDVDGELQALEWAEATLKQELEALAKQRETEGRLLTALGGAGGMVLALLLL